MSDAPQADTRLHQLANTISGVLCDAATIPVPADCTDVAAVDKALRQLLTERDEARREAHVRNCTCHVMQVSGGLAKSLTLDGVTSLVDNPPMSLDPRCAALRAGKD